MVPGILFGFGAATLQAISYFFSRRWTARHDGASFKLFAVGNVVMGACGLALLPMVWAEEMPTFSRLAPPLFTTTAFFMAGQFFLLQALKRTDSSVVSAMLGLKILAVAVLGTLAMDQDYSLTQWGAVGLCMAGAVLLHYAGGPVRTTGVVLVICACFSYSVSDFGIRELAACFEGVGKLRQALLTAACYLLCTGTVSLPLVLGLKSSRAMWRDAAPYAVAFFAAMICLAGAFTALGVAHGVIVQSTRGIIAIGIGWLIARAGHHHIESRVHAGVLVRRLVAASAMLAAVALFKLG